jgi:hypothetical protein
MATNPNDLAKLLNEMMSTLQDLSKKELESVESIIQEQKKNLEVEKKTKDAKKELARIKKETKKTESKIKSEEKKNLEKKNSLLASLKDSTKKLGKHSLKMSFEKTPSVKDLFGKVSINVIPKIPPKVSSVVSRQSSIDFTRKEDVEDIQLEQLHVLREIDKKVSDMSAAGSGGLFDFLTKGLGEFVSNTVSSILGAGSGTAAGGLLGGLGGKLGGKLGKVGKLVIKAGKSKAGLIAGGVTLAGMAGFGAYKFMSGDSTEETPETIEPRQFGGSAKANKTYLVGEDGPEVFSPKSDGVIIPNHKLNSPKKNLGFTDNLVSVIEDFRKGFQKNLKLMFGKFTTSFKDFGKTIWDRISGIYDAVKTWVSGYIDDIKGKAKEVVESSKSIISDVIDSIKKMIPTDTEDITQPIQPDVVQNNVSPIDSQILDRFNKFQVPDINVPVQPITIENSYLPYKEQEVQEEDELDKDFWTKDFLSAFSNSLVSKRPESKSRTVRPSSPW